MKEFVAEDYISFPTEKKEAVPLRIELVEGILQEFGATLAATEDGRNIWEYKGEYFRVDSFNNTEPVITIEYSDKLTGPYEDTDLCPYDSLVSDFYELVRAVLGFDYAIDGGISMYKGEPIPPGTIKTHDTILAKSKNYVVYGSYEYGYLKNILTGEEVCLGKLYGEPGAALVDRDGSFCVIEGGEQLVIYFIKQSTSKRVFIPFNWVYYIIQESADCIKVKIEGSPVININVFEVADGYRFE